MTWSWTLLRAGGFRLDGGSMFGVVPRTLWSKFVAPDDSNRIPLHANCLLLRDGARTVVVETGYGDKWSDKERGFYDLERRTIVDALQDENVDPADVDHVVVTHLHFDHAGGLTSLDADGAAALCFPNATVHVQQQEWLDANANRSTMSRTYLRNHLDPIADRVQLTDGAAEPIAGLRVEPMPGHTWGQQMILFDDDDGTLAFAGDVLPTVHHAGPAFSMGYDMEPFTNRQSKVALLARAAEHGWRLVLDHEPNTPVVRVAPDPKRPDRMTLSPCGASFAG